MPRPALKIDGTRFRDSRNREVTFRGINVAGDAKLPRNPDVPSHRPENFFDGNNVSFVGRPFDRKEAHVHFARLKRWGYNSIRYVFTWEAIEHAGPRQYDEDFITHTIEILRIAKRYGFYIFMDPHQDVWSRFSGGSGAPLWTLYACGLNPEAFAPTEAAFVHNIYPNPASYPKMLWSTNYNRLACQTLFTFFFAGKDFAPNAIIDGKNIQDFLQEHYIAACRHLAERIHEAGDLEDECVIGWESWNEPNRGIIGWEDLSVIPAEQQLKKGTCPTAWQGMLLGSGRALEIDTFEFGSFGPYKNGRTLVDPRGASAWLPTSYDDSAYGWKRDANWRLGECIWAQHGVWDPKQDILLRKDYFSRMPKTGEKLNYERFTNTYFLNHYRAFRDAIRSVHKDCMMLLQAPVLEVPPDIRGTVDDDARTIFASHYYDGLTLLTKHWNRYYNVDVFGVMRGRYLSPAFALKIGETAIRNCLRDQLEAIRKEGLEYTGNHPCVFTEIGIPYDMDDKYAYKTGDYSAQVAAMDANHFALEGSGAAGYTLWTYVGTNTHEWGDRWNGEDLSILSLNDRALPSQASPSTTASTVSLSGPSAPAPMKPHPSVSTTSIAAPSSGLRAAEAYIRPSPLLTHGSVTSYNFDLHNCTFTLTLSCSFPAAEDAPTEIYLPDYHFPPPNTSIEVSDGKWQVDADSVDGETMQMLRWFHGKGEQKIKVTGLKRRMQDTVEEDEEVGYLSMLRKIVSRFMGNP